MPNHGHLQPGKQQLVTVSFYAQENTRKEAVAQCHVEGGPTYQVNLLGEATLISYTLDSPHVDFGLQVRQLILPDFECYQIFNSSVEHWRQARAAVATLNRQYILFSVQILSAV